MLSVSVGEAKNRLPYFLHLVEEERGDGIHMTVRHLRGAVDGHLGEVGMRRTLDRVVVVLLVSIALGVGRGMGLVSDVVGVSLNVHVIEMIGDVHSLHVPELRVKGA